MADNEEPMIETPSDFGQFLLEKELGHGGMGGVYLARDKMLDRRVAIKVMLKSLGDDVTFVERFQREAQAAARLNHPNIAQIYSFGQEQGMPYIAMELVSGGSLDKDMERNPGTLDPVRVMKIGQQLVDALATAAESGLVHGDVKPENVLFDGDGNAKLVDFGLAAMQAESDEIWGTPYYISPEKCRKQKVDFRADIYSLGGTLYHALTGLPPFDGPDPTAVVKARFEAPPRKPSEVRPDLPPEIDTIIMRMLELEPAMRYPTYQSLMGDFKRFLSKAKASGARTTAKTAAPKVKIKGIKTKMNLSADDSQSGASDGVADLPAEEAEAAEEKHLSVGAIVGMAAGGIVLLVLLVVGGLLWYVHAEKVREQREHQQMIVDKQQQARTAIGNTLKAVATFGENFHELVMKSEKEVATSLRDLRAKIPDELREEAKPFLEEPQSKDIEEAIAYTNQIFTAWAAEQAAAANQKAAEAKAAAEAAAAAQAATNKADSASATNQTATAAGTNQTAVATGGTNQTAAAEAPAKDAKDAKADAKDAKDAKPDAKDVKSDAKDAKDAKEAKPDAKEEKAEAKEEKAEAKEEKAEGEEEKKEDADKPPKMQMPAAIKQYAELWADLMACRAADIRVQGRIKLLLKRAEKASELKAEDLETTQALAKLSQQLVEEFDAIKGMKCVEQTQRKSGVIRSKALSLFRSAAAQITSAVKKAEREAKARAEAAAKKEAEEKAAAERKAKVEEESKTAQEEFDRLLPDLKHLDWDRALKRLNAALAELTTPEGKDEMRSQIKKVQALQALQKHFIAKIKGFKYRNVVVESADAKKMTMQTYRTVKGKATPERKIVVEWDRFYGRKEYVGMMNKMMNDLVIKGRETTRIGPMPWSECMLGSALTLQLLYSEVEGAEAFVPVLVKKAVKEFEPCRKYAEKWFPDVKLEEAENE